MTRKLVAVLIITAFISTAGFAQAAAEKPSAKPRQTMTRKGAPTVEEARKFITEAEERLKNLGIQLAHADWLAATYINEDSEVVSAYFNSQYAAAVTALATAARRYEKLKLPAELARKLKLLKLSLSAPTPRDPKLRDELTRINKSLEGEYSKAKYCPTPDKCLPLPEIEKVLAESRNPQELKDHWVGWHKVAPPMRARYTRFVELANIGAKEMGFKDVGAMWRSNYDMDPDAFAKEVDRLYEQVKPLYLALHTYVRKQLRAKYGPDVVPADGPIPAHLLGNMWAQEWGNIYPLVEPPGSGQGYDLTELLKEKGTDEIKMVKYGEGFFTSLGFAPLPETFWERSLFKKPQDREVVCHASAWSVDTQEDVRLKQCIKVKDEDFVVVHHELGHNFYQLAYRKQPYLFQDSANDGFHEAIGDTVALSVTPEYLKKVGLLQTVPPESADLGFLMKQALDKVAFLPFGLLVDQWRWKVFTGEIAPAEYNHSWWDLKLKYQGVSRPVTAPADAFDPGAKYHVPANVPYTRYFLAHILQYQFHRALCREAGFQGPLHRCSIYQNKQAGEKLIQMLEMGKSKEWQEALYAMTGERQIDATAILDYFAPLKKWLDEQNKGEKVGW